MKQRFFGLFLFITVLSLSACSVVEPLPSEPECSAAPICQIASNPLQSERILYDEQLRIFGSCQHPDGVAIRTIRVANQLVDNRPGTSPDGLTDSASSTNQNYAQWSISLDYNYLASLENSDGLAEVPIIATDACGQTTMFEPLQFELPTNARHDLQDLSLLIGYPNSAPGAEYLPIQPSALGIAEVRANVKAVGAEVKLVVSAEMSFVKPSEDREPDVAEPLDSREIMVTLAQSDGRAVARVPVYGVNEGVGSMTVTANNRQAFRLIEVAGPPDLDLFGPPSQPPGGRTRIDVSGDCDVDSCWASPEPDFDVYLTQNPDIDLMDGPTEAPDDNEFSITVISRTEDSSRKVSIICADIFGQIVTTEIRGESADLPPFEPDSEDESDDAEEQDE